MSNNQSETWHNVAPFLQIESEHLPEQSALFAQSLTAYLNDPSADTTGLRAMTLADMAHSLQTSYRHVELLLRRLDTAGQAEEEAGHERDDNDTA